MLIQEPRSHKPNREKKQRPTAKPIEIYLAIVELP